MNVFDLSAKITLDIKGYMEGLKKAQEKGSAFASKIGGGLSKAAKIGAAAFGVASGAVGAFVKSSVDAGRQFDTSMSQVAATLGYSTDEINDKTTEAGKNFDKLSEFAQKMGRETKFSATEAADALNFMALAGYDAEKSMRMLPTVLNMAAAGSMDLATASDMVTDAQTALGLSEKQTVEMTDQMAKAASSSNTSVSQLGNAFLTVGATARQVKGGSKELAQVFGLLADNGIKGSEAGTKFRNMIMKLTKPTKEGADYLKQFSEKLGHDLVFDEKTGEMRAFKDIFLDLNQAMDGFTEKDRSKALASLFNARDMAAANALMGTNVQRWDELAQKIDNAKGSAEKMAGVQLDNLEGDLTLFKSAWEGLQIAMSKVVTGPLREFVQLATEGVQNLAKALKEGGMTEAIQSFGDFLSKVASKIIGGLPEALTTISGIGLQVIQAIGQAIIDNGDKLVESLKKMLKNSIEKVVEYLPQIIDFLKTKVPGLITDITTFLTDTIIPQLPTVLQNIIETVTSLLDTWIPAIVTSATQLFSALVEQLPALITVLVDGLAAQLPLIVQGAMDMLRGIVLAIPKLIEELTAKAPEIINTIYNTLTNSVNIILTGAVQMFSGILHALPGIITQLANQLPNLITTIVNFLMDNVDNILNAAIDLLMAIVDATPQIAIALAKAMPKILLAGIKALLALKTRIFQAGITVFLKLAEAVPKVWVSIKKALGDLWDGIVGFFKNLPANMAQIGKNLIEGLWNGIKNMAAWIKEKITGFGKTVLDDLKDFFGIKSPSKVFAEVGKFLALGLGEGWDATIPSVIDDISHGLDFSGQTFTVAQKPSNDDKFEKSLAEMTNAIVTAVNESNNTTIELNSREIGRMVRTYA